MTINLDLEQSYVGSDCVIDPPKLCQFSIYLGCSSTTRCSLLPHVTGSRKCEFHTHCSSAINKSPLDFKYQRTSPWSKTFRVCRAFKELMLSVRLVNSYLNLSHGNRRHLWSKHFTWFHKTKAGLGTTSMVYTITSTRLQPMFSIFSLIRSSNIPSKKNNCASQNMIKISILS
jgi:hypothetical protein